MEPRVPVLASLCDQGQGRLPGVDPPKHSNAVHFFLHTVSGMGQRLEEEVFDLDSLPESISVLEPSRPVTDDNNHVEEEGVVAYFSILVVRCDVASFA